VLNTDNGAGHPKGWKVEGRTDLGDAMKPISQSLLAGMGGEGLSMDTTFDTDHGHFMPEGIRSLDLWVDMSGYGKVHHKSSDTIDKLDPHNRNGEGFETDITYSDCPKQRGGPLRRSLMRRRAAQSTSKRVGQVSQIIHRVAAYQYRTCELCPSLVKRIRLAG
jgi:hypothetical protein